MYRYSGRRDLQWPSDQTAASFRFSSVAMFSLPTDVDSQKSDLPIHWLRRVPSWELCIHRHVSRRQQSFPSDHLDILRCYFSGWFQCIDLVCVRVFLHLISRTTGFRSVRSDVSRSIRVDQTRRISLSALSSSGMWPMNSIGRFLFETTTTPKEWTIFKHVQRIRMQHPIRAFAYRTDQQPFRWELSRKLTGSFIVPWYFDETIVQGQVVSNGILPALFILTIILNWKERRWTLETMSGGTITGYWSMIYW